MSEQGVKVTELSKVEIPFGNELHLVSSFKNSQNQDLEIPESRAIELRKVAGFSNLIHSTLSYSVGFNTTDVPDVTNFSLYDGGTLDLDEKINHFIFDVPYKNELCFNLMIEYFVTVIYGNGYTANFRGNHTYIEINGQVLRQFTTDTTDLDSTYPPSIFGNAVHGNALYLKRIPYSAGDTETSPESGRRFRVYWQGMPSSTLGGATVTTSLRYSANVTDTKTLCGFSNSRLYGFDSVGNQIDADINGLISLDTTDPIYLIVDGNFLNNTPENPKITVNTNLDDFNGTVDVTLTSPDYSPNQQAYTISLFPSGETPISGTLRVSFTYDCGGDPPTVKNYEIVISEQGGGTGTTSSPTSTPTLLLAPYWLTSNDSFLLVTAQPSFAPTQERFYIGPDVYAPIINYPNSTINVTLDNFTTSGDPANQPTVFQFDVGSYDMVFGVDWRGFTTITIQIVDENSNVVETAFLTVEVTQTPP